MLLPAAKAGEKDAETMGADDPYDLKGVLKRLGVP
jgi:hypothetical protein